MAKIEAKNTIKCRSKAFALRVIRLCQYLQTTKSEYVMSRQLLECGTSIGAHICGVCCEEFHY